MIFVTVGTHEQQFNRLVKKIDELKEKGIIEEDVIVQSGYSDYEPKHCTWSKFLSYQDMCKYVKEARVVITHGGPSSFIAVLQEKKTPIVVPRQYQYAEHVNNHQLDFARVVAEKQKNIILIEEIEELENAIVNYEKLVGQDTEKIVSNNAKFIEGLDLIVKELVKE